MFIRDVIMDRQKRVRKSITVENKKGNNLEQFSVNIAAYEMAKSKKCSIDKNTEEFKTVEVAKEIIKLSKSHSSFIEEMAKLL